MMLEGVKIQSLEIFPNEKGDVMRMLRCDSPNFSKFGEIYFSMVNPGAVKGWKKHLRQTQNFAVPIGHIKLVIFDDRHGSASKGQVQEIMVGGSNYYLVCIPPQMWYSFMAVGHERALIVNCTDIPHDPDESVSAEINTDEIPYSWGMGHK